METLYEGATAFIKQSEYAGYVQKVYKRSRQWDLVVTEKGIHARISDILQKAKIPLRTPKLLDPHGCEYIMERVNTDHPLWDEEVWDSLDKKQQAHFLAILHAAFQCLWERGRYNLRDVEVYLQPDDTLMMLDFGQVNVASESPDQLGLQSAAVVPASIAAIFHRSIVGKN